MKIIKATYKFDTANPVYFVVGDENPYRSAEDLSKKHYPESTILEMEIISSHVIKEWA